MKSIEVLDFFINNDEIELVDRAISDTKMKISDCRDEKKLRKLQDDISKMLEIRKMLYAANQDVDPKKLVTIDSLRIKKTDFNRFFELLSKVNIKGLKVSSPLRKGDSLPGNKSEIKLPKDIKEGESISQHEAYLKDFYERNGGVPEISTEGVRAPYPHEKYNFELTENGYEITKKTSSKDPYYSFLKESFVNPLADLEIYGGAHVSAEPKEPVRVIASTPLPMDLQFFGRKSKKKVVSVESIKGALKDKVGKLLDLMKSDPEDFDYDYLRDEDDHLDYKVPDDSFEEQEESLPMEDYIEAWNMAAQHAWKKSARVVKTEVAPKQVVKSARKEVVSGSLRKRINDRTLDIPEFLLAPDEREELRAEQASLVVETESASPKLVESGKKAFATMTRTNTQMKDIVIPDFLLSPESRKKKEEASKVVAVEEASPELISSAVKSYDQGGKTSKTSKVVKVEEASPEMTRKGHELISSFVDEQYSKKVLGKRPSKKKGKKVISTEPAPDFVLEQIVALGGTKKAYTSNSITDAPVVESKPVIEVIDTTPVVEVIDTTPLVEVVDTNPVIEVIDTAQKKELPIDSTIEELSTYGSVSEVSIFDSVFDSIEVGEQRKNFTFGRVSSSDYAVLGLNTMAIDGRVPLNNGTIDQLTEVNTKQSKITGFLKTSFDKLSSVLRSKRKTEIMDDFTPFGSERKFK